MGNELDIATVVEVNERIRRIVLAADRVNMIALNAMFISRKAADNGQGFARVTRELRTFSEHLMQKMIQLRDVSSRLADAVAGETRRRRFSYLIRKARLDGKIQGLNTSTKIHTANRDLEVVNREFLHYLDQALGLIGVGESLVVLARVEAQSMGELSHLLGNIADEMTDVIEQIGFELRAGQKRLVA